MTVGPTWHLFLISTVILSLIIEGHAYDKVTPSSEKKLIKQLIDNYEKAGKIGRPVKNTKETVNVGFGLSLFQLMDLDEKNQILTVNVWIKYTWVDQLLRWDPANYSNIREVRIPPSVIWTPDIVLYNYADERLKEQRDVMLNVDFTGSVFWSPPAIFKSNCRIDIRNFPFDYQYCYLRFASWTQHSEQLQLRFLDEKTEVDVDQYTPSNEWKLVARPARRFIMMSEQCGKTIPDLTFFLFLKRNPAFYGYLLVFPCVLLSLLTTVIFWLPPQIPAKMLLSMNIFVAFSLLLKILAGSTPSASTIVPFLGYYYCLNMTLLSVSTFISTVIINVHTHSHRRCDVPQWLARYVNMFATPLSITRPAEDDDPSENLSVMEANLLKKRLLQSQPWNPDGTEKVLPPSAINVSPGQFPFSISQQSLYNTSGWKRRDMLDAHGGPYGSSMVPPMERNMNWEFENTAQSNEFVREQLLLNSANTGWGPSGPPLALLRDDFSSTKHLNDNSNASGGSMGCCAALTKHWKSRRSTIQIQTSLGDLRQALKNLMNKISKKDAAARRAREWRLVVMTIDRMFFWFYLALIIGSGLYLLVPRGQSHSVSEVLQMHAELYKRRNKEIAAECLLPESQLH